MADQVAENMKAECGYRRTDSRAGAARGV